MRLLVVSNYYPPFFVGGYELGCADIVERLRDRGHDVIVLTSTFGVAANAPAEMDVHRILPLASSGRRAPIWHSVRLFTTFVRQARPDLVYFWNQAGLSFWLPIAARALRMRRLFFISDTSFLAWRVGALARRWYKAGSLETPERGSSGRWLQRSMLVQGRMITQGERCEFASEFLRRLDEDGEERRKGGASSVVHWGVDISRFSQRSSSTTTSGVFRLLFVGQVIPEKGIDTAIDAVAQAMGTLGSNVLSFTIVGGSSKPDYLAEQMAKVAALGLANSIVFAGKMHREALPQMYHEHDALLFPSVWDEPFAITPLEAMASGVVVIGTNTGGSAEIFRARENSLVFPAREVSACAAAIVELCRNRELYLRLQRNALQLVRERYSIEHMIDQIEGDLQQAVR